jgi:hypothetical protein
LKQQKWQNKTLQRRLPTSNGGKKENSNFLKQGASNLE